MVGKIDSKKLDFLFFFASSNEKRVKTAEEFTFAVFLSHFFQAALAFPPSLSLSLSLFLTTTTTMRLSAAAASSRAGTALPLRGAAAAAAPMHQCQRRRRLQRQTIATASIDDASSSPSPSSERKRLAVFVSGGGSNLRAIHAATQDGRLDAEVVVRERLEKSFFGNVFQSTRPLKEKKRNSTSSTFLSLSLSSEP